MDGCPSHFLIKLPCSRARRTVVVPPSRFPARLSPDLLKWFSVADMTPCVWRREAAGASAEPKRREKQDARASNLPPLVRAQLFGITVHIKTHLFCTFLDLFHPGPLWIFFLSKTITVQAAAGKRRPIRNAQQFSI